MKKANSFSKFILAATISSLISLGCTQNSEVKTNTNKQGANISANSAVNNGNSTANRQ